MCLLPAEIPTGTKPVGDRTKREINMSTEYNAVQESIKIALDAADAATDVTSEFNKIKRDNKKLESGMKAVHRYTVIIFASSMVAAVVALVFAAMIYFRTMSDLTTMTTTSREALVVFAENVESVNGSLQNLKDALSTQEKLVEQNKELIAQLDGLKQVTLRSSEQSVNAMKQAAVDISVTNKQLAANIADGIAAEMQSMATRVGRDIAAMEEASAASRANMMATISQTKDGERVAANQRMIIKNMNDLAAQNKEIIRKFDEKDNRVSYP
jgi:hypothetical protein